jgi:hypothetical protein
VVDIDVDGGVVTFRVTGLHKLWALKSRIVVPVQDIVAVEGPDAIPRSAGWRVAGTAMPGVITAGTYRRDGAWTFWDVVQAHQAIVVTVRGRWYSRLVVEVANPDRARGLLTVAMASGRAQPREYPGDTASGPTRATAT